MTSPNPPPQHDPIQPAAGWYPDANLGMLRYWDGNAWTEHLTPYPDGDPGAPPPPGANDAIPGAASSTSPGDAPAVGRLAPMGEWLSESFRLVIDQRGHLFTLVVVLTLGIDLVAAAFTWLGVRDLVITFDSDAGTISSTGASGWLFGAFVASVLSIMAKLALAAGAARHVLAARTGVPESWSDTLRETVTRFPRLLGAICLFFGAVLVVYVAVFVPMGLIVAVVPPLGIFAIFAGFVAVLAGVARIVFGPIAAVIAPLGQGGIRRSVQLTKGSTSDMLKRLAMLAVIGITMTLIASLFTSPFLGGDAELITTDDRFDFSQVIGDNAGAFGLAQVLSGLVFGAFACLAGGALGLLYADLGGPVEASITDVDPTALPHST